MASVGSIVGGAFAVFRQRPGAVALWTATMVVGLILLQLMLRAVMGGAAAVSLAGQSGDPTAALAMVSQMAGPLLLYFILYLFLIVVVMNAVFRGMLRPEEGIFRTVRVGPDEFRMLGLCVVYFVAFFVLYIIVVLLFVMLAGGLGLATQGNAGAGVAIGGLLGLVLFCAAVWFYVRISLLFPLSFYRRSFIELDGAWRLTRGRFWILLGSYLIVAVVMLILYILMAWASGSFAMLAALSSGGAADAQYIMAQRAQSQGIAVQLLVAVVSAAVFTLGWAVIASATRELLAADGESLDGDVERTAEIFE